MEPRNHSEQCRERITKELEKTEEGKTQLRKENERIARGILMDPLDDVDDDIVDKDVLACMFMT